MKWVQIMVSIIVSVKHCSLWNMRSICRVLSAHAAGRAWPRNSLISSPATASVRHWQPECFPFCEQSVFSAFGQLCNFDGSTFCIHWLSYSCSVVGLPDSYFIPSNRRRLQSNNIHQCQLAMSWLTTVPCGPIVVQDLQFIFDFTSLDKVSDLRDMGKIIPNML